MPGQIKSHKIYGALRAEGYSAGKAARISNAQVAKRKKKRRRIRVRRVV